MPLTLTVLRCPDTVPPETRSVAGGEFTVGRGPGVDWVLPDPERTLSKHHFAVAFRGGSWQIADTSTNGTTLNRDPAPIGQAELRVLRDGDRLSLGSYEIEVRLVEDAMPSAGMGMGAGFGGQPAAGFGAQPGAGFGAQAPGRGGSPFADPFAMDPLAPPPPARRPFDEPPQSHFGIPTAAQLPADFDPLAPEPGEAPFLGPTRSDHTPVLQDAFHPPATAGYTPAHTGGILPGDDMLPDDWDKDLLEGINPQPAPPPIAPPIAPLAPRPAPQPVAKPMAPPVPQPVVQQPVSPAAPPIDTDPFAEPPPAPRGLPAEAPKARDPESTMFERSAPRTPTPFDEPFDLEPAPPAVPLPTAPPASAPPLAAARPPLQPPPATAATPPVTDAPLLAAFLQGAGMTDVQPGDPAAMMRSLGEAFRTLVSGLREVLIARASIKSEFRIEQTMIRARGNNPLKFSAGDDDALAALLQGGGRRTEMTAAAAVADALKDIRLHELASMAAMQAAVRTLLVGLDPAKLREQADHGGMSVLPLQKKARAWDAFEALHTRTVQALADDFDSVFGKAFARAYERALDEVATKER